MKGVSDGRPRFGARWDVNSNCAGWLYYSKVEMYNRGEPLSLSISTRCIVQSPLPLNFRCTNHQFYKRQIWQIANRCSTEVNMQTVRNPTGFTYLTNRFHLTTNKRKTNKHQRPPTLPMSLSSFVTLPSKTNKNNRNKTIQEQKERQRDSHAARKDCGHGSPGV